jgi:hypothetical protein
MIEDRIDERLCRRLLSRRKGQAVQRHGKARLPSRLDPGGGGRSFPDATAPTSLVPTDIMETESTAVPYCRHLA